jgi:hypothetical protein
MAFFAAFFFFNGKRPKCNALIKFDIIADYCGFTYNYAGSVIDKKRLAYFSARMNVDARPPVNKLAPHSRYKGYIPRPEKVRYAVQCNRLKTGIRENNLIGVYRGRIAPDCGFKVFGKKHPDF